MTNRTGHCLCGSVSYEVEGDPSFVGVCHCKDCQRQAGTSFSFIIGVPSSQLKLSGDTVKEYVTHSDSGNDVVRKFCGTCGSPILSELAAQPTMAYVKAGTLDDVSGLTPMAHVWCSSKMDWVDIPEGIPALEKQT
ncbi:MAG: GFA family protein [Alphaproteobacteria bacterium]|nr:MAG: GFA family protein [Alphaproteobacteria bacterium]